MPEAADREKDFIIVNKTFGYIMNIEVKSSPNKNAVNSVREQLIHTKNLLTDWFGGTHLLEKFKHISVFFTGEAYQQENNVNNKFWMFGKEQFTTKMNEIHSELNPCPILPSKENFEELAKNLLFYTTARQLPIKCNVDKFVDKSFQGVTAEDVDFWNCFWNLTPGQMSLMHSDKRCVLFTSPFSTGKTMLMVDKAEKVAKADKDVEVLFAISSAHSGWPPIMLRAKLENSFQVNAIENVKVFFVDVGLQPLTELIEGNSSQPIFVDEVCIKDGDLEKIEELAKNQSMYLWIAQTGLETSMERKWTSWLSNQSAFHIPQLSYCMRNSKSIFHESEKASQVYSSFRHSSTSDRVQLPAGQCGRRQCQNYRAGER